MLCGVTCSPNGSAGDKGLGTEQYNPHKEPTQERRRTATDLWAERWPTTAAMSKYTATKQWTGTWRWWGDACNGRDNNDHYPMARYWVGCCWETGKINIHIIIVVVSFLPLFLPLVMSDCWMAGNNDGQTNPLQLSSTSTVTIYEPVSRVGRGNTRCYRRREKDMEEGIIC